MPPRSKKQKKAGHENEIPIDMKLFDRNIYGTSSKDYPLWTDLLFEKIKLPFPLPAILLGIVAYLIGLLISATINFQSGYVNSFPIYVGAFGIAWVLGVEQYASKEIHNAYEELRPCFLIDDKTYSKTIKKWFEIFTANRGNFQGIFILLIIAMAAVYVTFYFPEVVESMNVISLRVFPPYWYSPENKIVKMIIIDVWGVLVAFPLGTAIRFLIVNFFFLLRLKDFPVIPVPSMIKARLQKINNLYIFISSTWFVGVGLFGVLLFDKLDVLAIIILGALSFLGTLTFLTPQFIYRRFLIQSHKIASQWTLRSFYSNLGIEVREKALSGVSTEIGSNLAKMNDLKGFIEVSKQSDTWVYDPSDFIFLLLGQVVSFGSVYFEKTIMSLFSSLS